MPKPIWSAPLQGSDVIFFATPVGCILSQFEKIAPLVPPDTLITDAGSTKQQFVERARMIYGADASTRVLPGHPMAGKEHGGIEHADAELFRNAAWLITPIDPRRSPTQRGSRSSSICSRASARA